MKPDHIITAVALALYVATPGGAWAAGPDKTMIKKCQDAKGRWHYGDTAARECAEAKITEINKGGFEVREIAAPLTPEQLKEREQEKQAEERAKQRALEQARRDKILLSNYANENDLVQTRDRKIAEVDTQIKASNDTLAALRAALARYQKQADAESRRGGKPSAATATGLARTEVQIAKQEQFIQGKHKELETIRTQFDTDIERFRELKNPVRRAPGGGER